MEGVVVGPTDCLVVTDVQPDFLPGGALAVPGGDGVLPVIARLLPRFAHVIATQDWHPPGHLSFASSHPGRAPGDTILAAYGPQVLWPDHCVQGTPGAALDARLDTRRYELVVRKGFRPELDAYSAFRENDRTTPTGLAGYLRERGCDRIFFVGLALDFCVRWSAEDARAAGFGVVVIEDGCRALDVRGSLAEARRALHAAGAVWTTSDRVGSDR